MREIKFRAWDKDNKCWLPSELFEKGELFLYWETNESGKFYIHDKTNTGYTSIVLMQYSGLKDKNGTEIYEGDNIKALYLALDDFSPEEISGTIGWRNETFNWVLYHTPNTPECIELWKLTEIEIIGNIHENPELIVDKDND